MHRCQHNLSRRRRIDYYLQQRRKFRRFSRVGVRHTPCWSTVSVSSPALTSSSSVGSNEVYFYMCLVDYVNMWVLYCVMCLVIRMVPQCWLSLTVLSLDGWFCGLVCWDDPQISGPVIWAGQNFTWYCNKNSWLPRNVGRHIIIGWQETQRDAISL